MVSSATAPQSRPGLIPDEREAFRRDGFLILRGLATPDDVAALRAVAVDRPLAGDEDEVLPDEGNPRLPGEGRDGPQRNISALVIRSGTCRAVIVVSPPPAPL